MKEVCENDLSYLEVKGLRFGGYAGQTRCLRKEAIKLWGEKEVAPLPDFDVEKSLKR